MEAVRNADGTFSGDWDAVIHLNATGPGSVDINGATDINTKLKPPTTSFSNELRMGDGGASRVSQRDRRDESGNIVSPVC